VSAVPDPPSSTDNPIDDLERTLRPWLLLHKASWRRLYGNHRQRAWVALMIELHQAIRATTPLLVAAANRADELGPQYRSFGAWAREHAAEEANHEKWLAEDLGTIGVDRDGLEQRLPRPEIAGLLGTQFLLATSEHPAAILGYFYFAECHAADPAGLARQRHELGLPSSAMRTLRFHAAEDLEHQHEIRQMLLAHRPGDTPGMILSAVSFVDAWTQVYAALAAALEVSDQEGVA
jgi:hypothetical protein